MRHHREDVETGLAAVATLEVTSERCPFALFQHVGGVAFVAEFRHGERHVARVVPLRNAVDGEPKLIIYHLWIELKFGAHKVGAAHLQFKGAPPCRFEFLARQSVFALAQMHAHVGDLVGNVGGFVGHEINVCAIHHHRTRGLGETLAILGNAHLVAAGECAVAQIVGDGAIVGQKIIDHRLVFNLHIHLIFAFTVLILHLQTHALLVEEVVTHLGALLGGSGWRCASETPVPLVGETLGGIGELHRSQRSHQWQMA